jgi:hypothetical protein
MIFSSSQGSATQVPLIWAFGTNRPADNANSGLQQHIESGIFSLDLTKTLQEGITIPRGSTSIPFEPYQKTIIAHAVLSALGFLILLPAGTLVARWTRTYSRKWFTNHWIIQSGLGKYSFFFFFLVRWADCMCNDIGGVSVIVGIILGFVSVNQHGMDIPSTHKVSTLRYAHINYSLLLT